MNRYLKWSLLCLVAIVAGLYLQLFGFNSPLQKTVAQPQASGFFWPQQKPLSPFSMVDQDNQPFNQDHLSGQWSLLFFGYTYCPDICPITMYTLQTLDKNLRTASPSHALNYIFVSVDGERDTPEHLKQYINYFGNAFSAATGDKQQVDSLAAQLGVPYKIHKKEAQDNDYLVDHSGALFLISPENTLAAIFQPPYAAPSLQTDITQIIAFMAQSKKS